MIKLSCVSVIIFLLIIKNGDFKQKVRIIGGHPALESQFPFAAAIQVQTRTSRFFCGGSLYSRQWIITAGQCVNGAISFNISLGSVYLEGEDPARLIVSTSHYSLHPDYNSETFENDIGIIQLRLPIEYTDFIKPVTALPSNPLQDYSYLRIIGWGQNGDSSSTYTNRLQYAYVSSLSNQDCKLIYGNQIKDNMVCIEGNYNEGICYGDIGGPLVNVYGKHELVHVGIASFISGNGCESTDPSGFTRTYPYVDWIKNITQT